MENDEIKLDPNEEEIPSPVMEEKPKYHPRPAWQVWAARVGVVIMVICIILYYIHIATGGMR